MALLVRGRRRRTDATRTWRGSSGATSRLIAPPLPEASQPSNSASTGGPSGWSSREPGTGRPPHSRRSANSRCWAASSRSASSWRDNLSDRSRSSSRPTSRAYPLSPCRRTVGRSQPLVPAPRRGRPRALARARRLPRVAAPPRGRRPLGLLRGPAHCQRPARRPPRAGARVQGHLPPLQDHARLLRRAQGRLGLPRPAGGDRRSRRSSASTGKADIEELRHRGVQRALPRVGLRATSRTGTALTERIGVLGRPRRRLPDARHRLRRVGLVGAEARSGTRACSTRATRSCPTARAAARRCPSHELGRPALPGRRRPVGLRPLPGGRAGGAAAAPATSCWPGRRRRGRCVSNAALAVDPDLRYVRARDPDAGASSCWPRRSSRRCSARTPRCSTGSPAPSCSARAYEPPFPFIPGERLRRKGHTVLAADFVSAEDGTGLVHTAVAFGEDDFRLGEQQGLTVVNPVRLDGTFDERIGPYAGRASSRTPTRSHRGPARARPRCSAPRTTSTPTRTAGAAARRSSTTPSRPGTSRTRRIATGCSRPTRRSTGTPSTSSTGASATGWRTTSTGRCRASATGARRCRCGAATSGHTTCIGSLRRARASAAACASRTRTGRTWTTSPSRARECGGRDARACPRSSTSGSTRLHAVRAVARPVRERRSSSSSASRPTTSARRSTRRAAGSTRCSRSRRCSSTGPPYENVLCLGPDPRRRRPEDVEVAAATSSTRGRCSTATAPTRCAGTSSPPSSRGTATASRRARSARRCASSCCSCGTRTLLRPLRERRRRRRRRRAGEPTRARPLGALAPHRDGRVVDRAARRLTTRRPPAARSRRSSTTSRTGTCGARAGASGTATAAAFATLRDLPAHGRAAAGAVHAVHRRRDLRQPRRHASPACTCATAPSRAHARRGARGGDGRRARDRAARARARAARPRSRCASRCARPSSSPPAREREAIERLADVVRDELNVKELRFVPPADELGTLRGQAQLPRARPALRHAHAAGGRRGRGARPAARGGGAARGPRRSAIIVDGHDHTLGPST